MAGNEPPKTRVDASGHWIWVMHEIIIGLITQQLKESLGLKPESQEKIVYQDVWMRLQQLENC